MVIFDVQKTVGTGGRVQPAEIIGAHGNRMFVVAMQSGDLFEVHESEIFPLTATELTFDDGEAVEVERADFDLSAAPAETTETPRVP